MRRRVTVFVIAAIALGAVAISRTTADAAGPSKQLALLAKYDDLHAKRPAAATSRVAVRTARLADATVPATATPAPNGVEAQSQAFTVEQLQFFEALRQQALRDYLQGVYVLDGWARYGRSLSCIRNRESHGNYQAVNRRSRAAGAYQFLQGTWNSTAATADRPDLVGVFPASARPFDQDYLAIKLMEARGYAPWSGGRSCR
ncbi:MAG: transglycosylase family protein [Acidimicrobiia bacterium]